MKNITNIREDSGMGASRGNLCVFRRFTLISFVFFAFHAMVFSQTSNQIIGFAAATGLGLSATTGGEGGTVVTATNAEALKTYMDSNDKMIIYVSGTIDLGGDMTPLRSNKSILGLGNNAKIINGGLELYKRSNIIIRNITFENAPDDCMKVNQMTHHLWVDHCTFTDGAVADPDGSDHDGLFDITRESSFITISYCLFLNHAKTILIGHSDSYSADAGDLKVSIHHNWFNGTRSRHPRVRFGMVHVFNNYYTDNAEYGVASTCEADVVVEGNYFKNVPYPAYVGYAESPVGDLVARNNVFYNSGTPQTRGTAFEPSAYYAYTLDNASNIPTLVAANAGAGKITVSAPSAAKSEGTLAYDDQKIVKDIAVLPVYPNPAGTSATLPILVNETSKVKVVLYHGTGQKVKEITSGILDNGYHQLYIDLSGLVPGIYIYKVETAKGSINKTFVVK